MTRDEESNGGSDSSNNKMSKIIYNISINTANAEDLYANAYQAEIISESIRNCQQVHCQNFTLETETTDTQFFEKVKNKIIEIYSNLTLAFTFTPRRGRSSSKTIIYNDESRNSTIINLSCSPGTADISFVSRNPKDIEKLKSLVEFFDTEAVNPDKKQNAFIIADEYGEKYLKSVGAIAHTLEKLNYNDSTVDDFNYIVSNLKKKDPAGRLVVISGPPGTGKTYFIRGIINELDENSKIVLLPVRMVSILDSTQVMSLIISNSIDNTEDFQTGRRRRRKQNINVVLVIEDADSILVEKSTDNVSTLSTILSYTDGLFGVISDMRVIVSTNINEEEFDKAILRPGRLLKKVDINFLEPQKANEVYERISGDVNNKPFIEKISLAEIYAATVGIEVNKQKSTKVGF